jgi:branched-chain amino acid transport system substrate-binding protein
MTTEKKDSQTTIYIPSPFPQRKQKSRKKRYLSVFLILLVISIIFAWHIFSGKEPVYIAVSGPISGSRQPNGEAMVQGIRLYLDEINQEGGIDGRPIKLLVYNDQNKPELAKANALEIATQTQALAVIGHYSSTTSLAASPIYKEYGVPAITGSATADALTNENNWYFRTIFNNSDQGALIANYVRKILGYEEASILYDEDAYGSTLKDAFTHTAKRIGLSIKHQWSFDSVEPTEVKKTIYQMFDDVKKAPEEAGMLFFAIHSTEAVRAIVKLPQIRQVRVSIIGADALSSSNFTDKLSQFPQEQAQPGYFSDGVYALLPFLLEFAPSEQMTPFILKFLEKYQHRPTISSALYYDVAKIAIHAIENITLKKKQYIEKQRREVRDNLLGLSQLENAIEGVTGYLYFDKTRDAIKSIPVGIYKNGIPNVAIRQYQPLSQTRLIGGDLLQKSLDNKIISVNHRLMSQTEVVFVGIDFNKISELNPQTSTFLADFYLWFRFKGDFDYQNIEFMNILNQENNRLRMPIIEHVSEGKVTTITYRIKMPFKAELAFHKYPLDRQVLPISFRHKILTRDKLIYVVDAQGMDIHQMGDKKTRDAFSIGGWKMKDVLFSQNSLKHHSTLGIPELFGSRQRIEYSQFNAIITIERNYWDVIFKKLLPPLLLVVLGYLSFFVPSSAFGTRLALGTFMIAATTPFYLNVTSELPKIDYTLLIEYFFYLIYFLAILTIAIAISVYIKSDDEDNDSRKFVKRLNFWGKWLYKVILITGGATLLYAFI